MVVDDEVTARELLADVGRKRKQLAQDVAVLREETKDALRKTNGVIPLTEAARLVGLNRVTLYQEDYVGGGGGGGTGGSNRSANGGAKQSQRNKKRPGRVKA